MEIHQPAPKTALKRRIVSYKTQISSKDLGNTFLKSKNHPICGGVVLILHYGTGTAIVGNLSLKSTSPNSL